MALPVPMWISYMMFGWTKNTLSLIMPLMIVIEFTSNLIRLLANMFTGCLLMSLLGEKSMLLMMIMIIMMMFETAVAVIQSYMFTTLMTLYSSEL